MEVVMKHVVVKEKRSEGGFLDLTGKRFGKLVALRREEKNEGKTRWTCRCDCGTTKSIPLDSLRSGKGISCGCFRKEVTSKNMKTHGKTNTRLYNIWQMMKTRCENIEYARYAGRGIRVCDEWSEFEAFHDWAVKNGYEENLTIDRIDNDGNYEPTNCRWATYIEQQNNTSLNVKTEIRGEIVTLAEAARKYNVNYSALYYRFKQGLRGEELLRAYSSPKVIEYNGKTMNLKDWSRYLGFSYGTLQQRYKKGLRPPELFGPLNAIASKNANKLKKVGNS